MEYRNLGKTGIKASLLSLGTGGARQFGQTQGHSIDKQKQLIKKALDLGINLIDSSSNYNNSEELLGKCLTDIPRDTYHICTKWPARDSSGQTITNPKILTEAIDSSLTKLNVDYIDVMMLHGVLPEEYDLIADNLAGTLIDAKKSGKIRSIGLSTRFSVDPAQKGALEALEKHPTLWEVLMVKYGILNQYAAKRILPLAQKHSIGIMNMAAVRVKLPDEKLLEELIEKWKTENKIEVDSLPSKSPLRWLLNEEVSSVIDAGYKFAAEPKSISTVLTGTATISHLESNVKYLENPRLNKIDSDRLKCLFQDIVEYV